MRVTRKVLQTTIAYGLTTIVGFLGTLYFARTLGPGPIGTFALGVSLVVWGTTIDFGFGISAVKRISEGDRQSAFFSATLLLYALVIIAYVLILVIARETVNEYVGADVATFVVLLFIGKMAYGGVTNAIKGLNSAHVKNWIDVLERISRIAVQATLVAVGLSFVGLYVGYIVSFGIGLFASSLYIFSRKDISLAVPSRAEFSDLFDFAKFSWLGRLKSQSVSWMDVFVLGFFASQSLVGVYQVAWTISKTLGLLPKAISTNVFPEVSGLELNDQERIQMLVNEGLVYAGFVAIPGTVGAVMIGRRVLGIYGQEFQTGTVILVLLSAAAVTRGYEQQLLSIIDSLDRPEITFRVNLLFVASNLGLNIFLIWLYGPVGAAMATLGSTTISLSLAWYATNRIINVRFPIREILNQVGAAIWMGVVVAGLNTVSLFDGIVELVILVIIGICVYLITTIAISEKIREKSRSIITG